MVAMRNAQKVGTHFVKKVNGFKKLLLCDSSLLNLFCSTHKLPLKYLLYDIPPASLNHEYPSWNENHACLSQEHNLLLRHSSSNCHCNEWMRLRAVVARIGSGKLNCYCSCDCVQGCSCCVQPSCGFAALVEAYLYTA
jgi:hypothetical protein